MTTYATFFRKGQLPGSYLSESAAGRPIDLSLNLDLGGLLDLWDLETVSRKGNAFTAKMTNGLQLKLSGSDLAYDDGIVSSGTLKELRILTGDGKTTLAKQEGLKLDAADFFSRAAVSLYKDVVTTFDGFGNRAEAIYRFSGYEFANWLRGGDDTLNGSDEAEELFGGAGDDEIRGGGGNDLLGGGSGEDFIDGGKGFDLLYFAADQALDSRHGIKLDAAKRTVLDPWGDEDSFSGIESFVGSAYADRMTGSDRDETFRGGSGRDVIDGEGGTDEIRYDFDRDPSLKSPRGVTVNLKEGRAVDGYLQKDKLSGIENVYGSAGDDGIVGSDGDNVLNGGRGADRLTGGKGHDTFAFDSYFLPFGESADTISDFDTRADSFQLDNDRYFQGLATTRTGGERRLADKSFAVGEHETGWNKNTRILYDKADGDLYYDQDGSGGDDDARVFAHLDNNPTLTASDFLVV